MFPLGFFGGFFFFFVPSCALTYSALYSAPGEGGEMKAAYRELIKAPEVLSAPVSNVSAQRARKSPVRTFRAPGRRGIRWIAGGMEKERALV